MRRHPIVLLAALCATVANGWLVACGSTVTGGGAATTSTGAATTSTGAGPSTGSGGASAGSGGTGGGAGGGAALAAPPPPGPLSAPDGTTSATFAVTRIHLGDTDPDGTPDLAGGWEHFGYNLDGVPAGDPGAFCKVQDNAPAAIVRQQGIHGIENSFGHLILPIILGLSNSTVPADVNAAVASGTWSMLATLDDLGAGASDNPIASQIARAGKLGATPKLDGTDAWPIVAGSSVACPSAYLVDDTWVSGPAVATLSIPLSLQSIAITLNVEHARVTMKLDPTHTKVTGGIIAGVLRTSDLLTQFLMAVATIDPSICSSDIQSITSQIDQASDILHDGTQDPSQDCDGISIGLGFDAVAAQISPSTVPPPPPPPNPCAG